MKAVSRNLSRSLLLLTLSTLWTSLPVGAQVWLEPQIGPSSPLWITFDARKPYAVVAEGIGFVSLWDLSDPRAPIRISSIPTNAQSAIIRSDLGLIATAGRSGRVSIWNLDGTPNGIPLIDQAKPFNAVALSLEGGLLAAGDTEGMLRFWRLRDRSLSKVVQAHKGGVTSIAVSRNLWASGSLDGTIQLWNLDGTPSGVPLQLGAQVFSVALSADGKTLIAGGKDGVLCLWQLDKAREKRPLKSHDQSVFSVAINSRGDLIASASVDGFLRLWNSDGTPHGDPIADWGDVLTSVSFSPTSDALGAVTLDRGINIWNLNPGLRRLPIRGYGGLVSPIAFSPDGRLIGRVGNDGTVRLLNLDGTPQGKPLVGPKYPRVITFSPAGDFLATAGEYYAKAEQKSSVILWNTDGTEVREIVWGSNSQTVALSISRDGTFFVALDAEGFVRIWTKGGTLLATLAPDTPEKRLDIYTKGFLALSNDDRVLCLVREGKAQLWSLEVDRSHRPNRLLGTVESVTALAASPTDNLLALATVRGYGFSTPDRRIELRRWDGSLVPGFHSVVGTDISSLAFSARGDVLISIDQSGILGFWNLDGTQRSPFIAAHQRFQPAVTASPASNIFASTGMDGLLKLWDLAPSLYSQFPGFTERSISSVAIFTAKGIIASGTIDGRVLLLDGEGTLRGPALVGLQGPVTTIKWSGDGSILAAEDDRYNIKLWREDGIPLPDLKLQTTQPELIGMSRSGHYLLVTDLSSWHLCSLLTHLCDSNPEGSCACPLG
jgi:WD40 repeat protein